MFVGGRCLFVIFSEENALALFVIALFVTALFVYLMLVIRMSHTWRDRHAYMNLKKTFTG